ncbi:DUF262 domain-containing protein [Pasteurella atlantica]|uniref:DUF262 domain-containing protein n=1 Tax=Pasteurellaceae TaxID=712 RepID=UPI00274911E6|nr:DUF262 domain-containing protein [Pasteurella atlantica]MDP8099651.1 DUF262 domain-containing protein [Pasteurella atlantica]MDP8107603.1 DUF262 domain-containing protein [Pasteurella atlantica]MDP8117297.1 DUF262 domain-containing protein [Pasteurella atlantica]
MIDNQEKVEVYSCTLKELLECNEIAINSSLKGKLCIPEYQRPYIWGEKQINKLLDDWIEYNQTDKNKPLFYLGSIILHKDNDKLNIIDGQQRITTALLLQKIKDEKIINDITYHNSTSIECIKKNLSYLNAIKNGEIFEYSEDKNVIHSINFEKINVTLVVTYNEDLAYTFFETQNTGGVRLSGSHILKAHHLRAIDTIKQINYQARKWESYDNEDIEYIACLLTKVRFWDNRHWKRFPFYRDERGIKQSITDEFTLKTSPEKEDISYYYGATVKDGERLLQMHESSYKMLKQPLSNGNNTLDYINDYVNLYLILFKLEKKDAHHQIDDRFYEFRDKLITGHNGTIFLKELFEISLICYVSRFGYYRIYEASLWLFRAIYSLRVSSERNVREDSVFKFVYDNQFIDNILEVFTPDELFNFLKKMRYKFNTENILNNEKEENNTVKTRFINSFNEYFKNMKSAQHYAENNTDFDKDLKQFINEKLNNKE